MKEGKLVTAGRAPVQSRKSHLPVVFWSSLHFHRPPHTIIYNTVIYFYSSQFLFFFRLVFFPGWASLSLSLGCSCFFISLFTTERMERSRHYLVISFGFVYSCAERSTATHLWSIQFPVSPRSSRQIRAVFFFSFLSVFIKHFRLGLASFLFFLASSPFLISYFFLASAFYVGRQTGPQY